ncbi:MAG: hypothetical protein KDI71_24565, partial [Xanthomonadales bacterium]|nr:hypothetical protein [Xanthomonadales bacterium]
MVVWFGFDSQLPGGTARSIIAGRLVDTTTGQPQGPVVRLDTGDPGINSSDPTVAYNPSTQEYLVVWCSETIGAHYELRAQRFSASNLQPRMAQTRQITEMGGPGDSNFSALVPKLAFNPDRNEFLVAYIGADSRVGMSDLQRDVFVQRLDSNANEIGGDDMRISSASTPDGERLVATSSRVDVAYSTVNKNYFVVWAADDPAAGLAQNELEIFGQLVDGATGVPEGTDDARLTTVGPAGSTFFLAEQPAVTAVDSNFAVVYRADTVQGFKEINGVRAGGATGLPFGGQQRLTFTTGGNARLPQIVLDEASGNLVVSFQGLEVVGSNPVFEFEVFVQRASQSLQPIGDEERWSVMGPDGSNEFGPFDTFAMTSLATSGGYYVVWSGDHDGDG